MRRPRTWTRWTKNSYNHVFFSWTNKIPKPSSDGGRKLTFTSTPLIRLHAWTETTLTFHVDIRGELNLRKTRSAYNVTMRLSRALIVAVEKK
jgi:hypothetical protein